MKDASFRAKLVARRTYCRPKEDGTYETWDEVCDRVTAHQRWLWERALGRVLNVDEEGELYELRQYMLSRKVLPSGRILWMGGTEQARRTEIALFNCCFATVRDVYSAVDAYYLLLNGCGVGFVPEAGLLNGFSKEAKIDVIRSDNNKTKGYPHNAERSYTNDDGEYVWQLKVGDSGVAWAKAFGKLLTMKRPVDRIVLDFSEIRAPGQRLSGYGWLSSGDEQISKALVKVCEILNRRADMLLDEMDILDIVNLTGTTLTSRRSAQIAMLRSDNKNAGRFASAKKDHYEKAPWRSQSNNTLVFYDKPSKLELRGLFAQMLEDGGSEPGLYNGEAALRRAPWFAGTNPCGEILLGDGGLCNLVEVDLGKFIHDPNNVTRAVRLIARANYRQTCVNLKDDVLSDKWHETQEFLRLCGVGLTGIVKFLDGIKAEKSSPEIAESIFRVLRVAATEGADSMAKELNLPQAKAITTVKPSGTLGKLMDTTEGLHRPIGRYIFNWIKFDANDPFVTELTQANYKVIPDPYSPNNVIVCVPVDYGAGNWDLVETDHGVVEVNLEPAITQLERYRLLMDNYVDHNASVTIYYDPSEVTEIVEWLFEEWDSYVGVSFILRADPTKTAKDLGYPYLPQEVVTKEAYEEYSGSLGEVNIDGGDMLSLEECGGGACPVR